MSTKDFTANVISATKVVPDGNFKDSKASGIWDINEVLDLIKGGNWPNAANFSPAAFVDGLFQTHLYNGNGGTQSIVNNIDLSGAGGLVWAKCRNIGYENMLTDTVRGTSGGYLQSDNTSAQATGGGSPALTAFNSNGFTLGSRDEINNGSGEFVSWTWRKQPKFFDIQTYTGNRQDTNSYQDITHNLGSTPGMILVKETSSADDWMVYHRSANSADGIVLRLNSTDAASDGGNVIFDVSEINSSSFRVGNMNNVNANGVSYVAYIFAHNDDDGGFGEPGDQDIIKCGTYTGNGVDDGPVITLGFEPQFFMFKKTSGTGSWFVYDTTRGWGTGDSTVSGTDSSGPYLLWSSAAEAATSNRLNPTSTGVKIHDSNDSWNENNSTFIYMAIRAGGMQTPTTASSVFSMDTFNNSGDPKYDSTHIVDMALIKLTDDTGGWFNYARPMRYKYLSTNAAGAEANASEAHFDHMRGFSSSDWGNDDYQAWMWKKARSFFDVITYTGTGSARTIAHNLGVAPEMMWIKCRSAATNWGVYYGDNTDYMILSSNGATQDNVNFWNDTSPTSSVFTLGSENDINKVNRTYIAYLFASASGVSKLGSYTGNGSTTGPTVDCGFSGSPSFILIKRTANTGSWYVFDSVRGIADGNESQLYLNSTSAEQTASDQIDPTSSGFQLVTNATGLNADGESYIFYAIAAIS